MISGRERRELALKALDVALDLRRSLKIDPYSPVCPFDSAEQLGVETRISELSSLEGIYFKEPGPLIFVSSGRPSGRRIFNCAHELGHHVFNHGKSYDQIRQRLLEEDSSDPTEFLADRFASYFLMPKLAVANAFVRRSWDIEKISPLQIYTIAGWLGVGYSTLIFHMRRGLNLIKQAQVDKLIKAKPKKIRSEILSEDTDQELVIVDNQWINRAVDIQVGDLALLPSGTIHEGDCIDLERTHKEGLLFTGIAPGRGRLVHPESGWATYVRVSRKGYTGRGLWRHLEDPDACLENQS